MLPRAKNEANNSSGLILGAGQEQLLSPFFPAFLVKHIVIQSLTFQIVSAALKVSKK